MAQVYLSLGSNLGDKEACLNRAIEVIGQVIGPVTARSAFYKTEPWGYQSNHLFLNACIAAETTLSPIDCLRLLKDAERSLGRQKAPENTYADRLIDIDILLYDNLVQDMFGLVLPHPLMHERSFVLEPLSEIAPDVVHPILKKTIRELWEILSLRP